MPKPGLKIIVVGAGILGASIAYHLSINGVDVELLDESVPMNVASTASFGWINANTPQKREYFRFRLQSMAQWRNLGKRFPRLPVRFCGAIDWDMDADELQPVFALYQELGYDTKLVDRNEISLLAPNLSNLPDLAIHNSSDAIADPATIAGVLLELAVENGARLRGSTRVTGFKTCNDRVSAIISDGDVIPCDRVVLCAGTQTSGLLENLGIHLPMENQQGILMTTNPFEALVDQLISSPKLHFWQMADGRFLAGETQAGDCEAVNIDEFAAGICAKLQGFLPRAGDVQKSGYRLATRPVPVDGLSIIDRAPGFSNLFFAVTHSGITLAPIIGKCLASDIVNDTRSDDLKAYSIERFIPASMAGAAS